MNSQAALDAFNSALFYTNRYCLSNVMGYSTSSIYNSTSATGLAGGWATASNATNILVTYFCNQQYVFTKNAQMIQAVAVSLLAATSMLYIA